MRSRAGCTFAVALGLLLLLGLALWIGPQVKRWLSPASEATTPGEELERRLNPTPVIRPNPATIIRQVRSLSRLETASYTIEKVITAESGQDALAFLFGDRLLFVAHGQVIAGVDLGKMQEGDVTVTEDDRVVMVLPPPEVFVVTLDNEKSFVYDRETGILGLNEDLETAARQAAEEEILEAALADGILEMARTNAEAYLERLITGFGFQEIIFVQA
ncbi:MAG TPA: DUF4230 domain-containing protein, partial [Anaerolineales bacterium]|nr:DUF4230 domain-containing protein [Anaerolineae bacterium]HIQ02119.1 DUF4230 domain-containing protein [Anaerolineales bacterium]